MNSTKKIQVKNLSGRLHNKKLLLFMIVPVVIIAGFQVYWLSENFKKEKTNLDLKTNIAFRESVWGLQAKKLKLDQYFNDSAGNLQVELKDGQPFGLRHSMKKEDVTGIINNITVQVNDSLIRNEEWTDETHQKIIQPDSFKTNSTGKKNVFITLSNTDILMKPDSAREIKIERRGPPGEIVRFLYRVDSLQDSLRVTEIHAAVDSTLKKQGLELTFTISRTDHPLSQKRTRPDKEVPHQITIGFAHPATYQMKLGYTSLYLLKKISAPVLFSLFLVGITFFSFIMLYRNLLQQKRLAAIKNEFISNITHELKTPIATVGVAIEALRNFNAINDPQRSKEYLDISQNELQRLSLLVDKVLKLSMFEKKEIELKTESMDMREVVQEVVSSMKLQIEKHQALVSVNTTGSSIIKGDRLHLLSVLFNLLDNSLKYGNVKIKIDISLNEKEKDLELIVADNGTGISPEYKDRLFEKFFRVPAGNTHNAKGYGLGLSYVAHVVEKHQGKIEVESQLGVGTKFIIVLPKNSTAEKREP